MGFQLTSSTINLIAKLTPFGRKQLVANNNSLIATFGLGDSDANYNVADALVTGQVPSEAGNVGPNNTVSNSTAMNPRIKSLLLVNGQGVVNKPVETNSMNISTNIVQNGQTTISGANLTQVVVDRNDFETDSLVNLYYSFGLSLNTAEDINYTGVTYSDGGFSGTTFSGLAATKVVVIAINSGNYGEMIDGKELKLELTTSAGTYTIYSTFQNDGTSLRTQDANYNDNSFVARSIDDRIAPLFSDSIMTPNGGVGSLSWATGFGTVKPFSLNKKELYNLQTDTNLGLNADTMVGIAYLDKGFIVITHPTIVASYDTVSSTASTVTLNSISTEVVQNVTCIANRGEFGGSTNITFGVNDVPRISELVLYDNAGNIIAIGKTDRHVTKNANEFKAFGVKIIL